MAKLMKFSGAVVPIKPDNNRDFSTEELCRIVGGKFELIELKKRRQTLVVLAKDANKLNLPTNFLAEVIANVGTEEYEIKGNALLCSLKELK